VRLGWLNWLALGLVFVVLLCPVFLPYGALLNATFSRVASQFIWFDNFTLHNINFVFFELSSTRLAVYNTFVLGIASATIGTVLALVISYVTTRQHHRPPRARLSRHRAGRDPGHRARRGAVSELCAAALRALARCGSC
jgi:ABC-type Fe3+ transport system permease subunit